VPAGRLDELQVSDIVPVNTFIGVAFTVKLAGFPADKVVLAGLVDRLKSGAPPTT
jgi:hypothetical protein